MHFQDYAFWLFVSGVIVCWAGFYALSKHRSWWKDALPAGGMMVAVAMLCATFGPTKPKSPEDIAKQESATRDSGRQKAIIEAMTACDYALQSHLRFPGSYSATIFSSANRQIETPNGWEIYKAFEAKNSFGGTLPHVGHCSITRGGAISVDISES